MNIRAGLLRPSPIWRQFMAQEGLDWVELPSGDEIAGGGFTVLVVPARTTPADVHAIAGHLAKGGALLAPASALPGLMESREERLKFILAADEFSSAGLIDVETDAQVPREANVLRTPQHTFAVFAGEWKGGVAVVLPFDPAEALTDVRAGFRSFYLDRDRLPWERASLVAKGGVRRLLRDALIYLHRARGIPYVHTWYYPGGHPNAFVFRIDTDGGEPADIESLHALLEEHRLPASWFLDVKTQEGMLHRYGEFAGHDIGVHCYEHRVFEAEAENRENIERAVSAMRGAGLEPAGYAAPYGYWDLFLGNVIDEMRFSYSSEFSWAYDTLPGAPVTPAGEYSTLQVPIHPVSVGILKRAGCPAASMKRYFTSAVNRCMTSGDPMFFYHHPSHREWAVMRELFAAVRATGVPAMTMAGFADWWRKRTDARFSVRNEGGNLLVERKGWQGGDRGAEVGGSVEGVGNSVGDGPGGVWLSVVTTDGRHALVPPSKELSLTGLPARPLPASVVPEDLLRIREWDFRERFGQFLLQLRGRP